MSGAALDADPRYAPALHVRGVVAQRLGQPALACSLFESAIACGGGRPSLYFDLIEAYRMDWRLDDALQVGRRASELWPDDAVLATALGFVLYDRGELDDAIALLRRVIAEAPDHPGAHMKLGQCLLAGGDSAGWPEYEWRFRQSGESPAPPPTTQPKWDGSDASAKTLLLVCDEGFGDVIQFARFIPLLAKRCRKMVIACGAEMRPFIFQQEGGADNFQHWRQMPAHDVYCHLNSVPGLLQTNVAAPPAPIPYIRADSDRALLWRDRLNTALPAGFRVGLAWAGNPAHLNDRRRSISFDHLLALTAIPGLALVGLQRSAAPVTMPELKGPAPFLDCGPQIGDFVDTAAIVENLHLLISVDSAPAHVAGAMGKPVWMLLPFTGDWRWPRGRTDTPWYPSVRLFRQSRPGDWSGVIAAVVRELRSAVSGERRMA